MAAGWRGSTLLRAEASRASRIAFRVDVSAEIGIGHVRRCLALAHALRSLGADVSFVTREQGVDSATMIGSEGYPVLGLARPVRGYVSLAGEPRHAKWGGVSQLEDAAETIEALRAFRPAWIVVDHYAFDARWHERVAADLGARICVIDDLADRALAADLLVDHNYSADHRVKYGAFASSVPRLLGGPRFALLGSDYAEAPRYAFSKQVRSIGIFMGGGDIGNVSSLVLDACRNHSGVAAGIEIVTTSANPWRASLTALASQSPDVQVSEDLPTLAPFFARHDLQIGAGGGASWERCCIGAPTIALVCADNQRGTVAGLAELGVIATVAENSPAAIGATVAALAGDMDRRRQLSEQSREIVDGHGAIRVALSMYAAEVELRDAAAEDAGRVYSWRNDERTRRYFRDPAPVALDGHVRWWAASLVNEDRRLLIARCGTRDVGVMRLDLSGASAEISLYVDPDLIGLGLGPALIRSVQRWVREREPRVDVLTAHVLPQNRASARAFSSSGFEQTSPTDWVWSR